MPAEVEQRSVSIDDLKVGINLRGGHAVVLVVSGVTGKAAPGKRTEAEEQSGAPEEELGQPQPEEKPKGIEVSVLLLDDEYEKMPGAKWKAEGATPDSGTAGDDALAVFTLAPGAEKATLTWGGDTADQHSTAVWVGMPEDREAAARCRLDNLGFTAGPTLEDDILAFQFEKDLEQTGSLDDVEQALIAAHGT